jgi:hypothetical protein
MIPRAHGRNVVSYGLDDAGGLMTQHDRLAEVEAGETVNDVQVAVTDAGSNRPNQHLARFGLVELDGFHRQRLLWSAKDSGLDLHGGHPSLASNKR